MQVVTGNKKNKIIFYIFAFIFLTTITFFEKTKTFNKKGIFELNKIELFGYEKIDHGALELELSSLLGQNLLLIKSEDITDIIKKNKLIREFTIRKHYPNRINIRIKEVTFVATLTKDKKKYLLTDNDILIPFNDELTNLDLPIIYGNKAEDYFNNFRGLLRINDFNLDLISSYYFFQINRWDLVINGKKTIKLPSKNLEKAIKIANRLLNNKKFGKYSVIDLRIDNKIITQ